MDSPLPLDDVLADATPLLDDTDPLQAELWCSDFLGAFWLQGADDATVGTIFADALPRLEKIASPEANLLCHSLAALGVAGAGDAADKLTASGVRAPEWAGAAGVTVDKCYRYGDDFGDQESLMYVFSRGGAEHAVFVLIDGLLGGIAKDAFVVDDVPAALEDLEGECANDPFMSLGPVDAAEARTRLERAFRRTDEIGGDDEELAEELGEDFPAARAFALTRLAALPAAAAGAPGTDDHDADALVADFLAAPEAADLDDPAWAERLVRVWVEHIAAAGDDPCRMSPARVEELLLDVTPGGVLLDAEGQRAVPAVAVAWVRWASRGASAGLSAEAVEFLGEAVAEVLDEFPAGYLDLHAVLYRHSNESVVDLRT